MFREIILPIFRSTRVCVTACGIMHPRCCRPEDIFGLLYAQQRTHCIMKDKYIQYLGYFMLNRGFTVLWRINTYLGYFMLNRGLTVLWRINTYLGYFMLNRGHTVLWRINTCQGYFSYFVRSDHFDISLYPWVCLFFLLTSNGYWIRWLYN